MAKYTVHLTQALGGMSGSAMVTVEADSVFTTPDWVLFNRGFENARADSVVAAFPAPKVVAVVSPTGDS